MYFYLCEWHVANNLIKAKRILTFRRLHELASSADVDRSIIRNVLYYQFKSGAMVCFHAKID